METIIERMRGKLEKFCKDLRELYSENLVSIILYGSFSKGNYIPKRSDINYFKKGNDKFFFLCDGGP